MISRVGPILVTGAAGFIGARLVHKLLESGEEVIGIDNLNDYYSIKLKFDRLTQIENNLLNYKGSWKFEKISIEDLTALKNVFNKYSPKVVVNLAAQAGVRYSLENPFSYIQSNLVGFANILEESRRNNINNLIYASSSSVYGGNTSMPFREDQEVNHPVSLYASTKKSNELMAHSYSHLFQIPSTGLRFFTVYGPWGRPDMAPIKFAKLILSGKPISIYNNGNMQRDFTYIDDVIEAVFRCCYKPATSNNTFDTSFPDPPTSFAPHRIFNIGNSNPVRLMKFIELLEDSLGVKAIKDFKPMQPGDVVGTAADTKLLEKWINFLPKVSLEEGLKYFSEWFKKYY